MGILMNIRTLGYEERFGADLLKTSSLPLEKKCFCLTEVLRS